MGNNMKKKMIQVDVITHQMLKELALANGMTMMSYLMKLAYEQKQKEMENK